MKKLTEEKIIEKANKTLDELAQIYDRGLAYDKYKELLDHYKKAYRRSKSIIKMSDEVGKTVYKEKELLTKNLNYTVKTAKEKLLFNVEEHKKSKKVLDLYKNKTSRYQELINVYASENAKLMKKLERYERLYGEIHHTFEEKDPGLENINLNDDIYKDMSIQEIIELEVPKSKGLILVNLKLKNFEDIIENIRFTTPLNSFLKSLYKYVKICFNEDVIVLHEKDNSFYILADISLSEKIKKSSLKLNSKRILFNSKIEFKIVNAICHKTDNIKDILDSLKDLYE